MLKKFSVKDLIIIAALAALGIAVKPLVGPFFKMISRPMGIPGGSFAGGFYMMWLVLAVVIVDKPFT
ncbi:MAG: ECF transporter S component, partial [Candidatus Cloacimonetes bacterium]|nr:ECF transporter S component [Candidatus Cloacimonadota bacterium]